MGKCLSKDKRETGVSFSLKTDNNPELLNLKFVENLESDNLLQHTLEDSLGNNHLFRGLDPSVLKLMIKKLRLYVADSNKFIFHQGSVGTLFFIINSGSVEVIVNNTVKSTLKKGNCFGEMALLSDSIRKATIKTQSKSSFWVLSQKVFFKTLKSMNSKSFEKIRSLVSKVWCFSKLSETKIAEVSRLANYHYYKNDEIIIQEDEVGSCVFILISGKLILKKRNVEFFRISCSGEIFGEGSLVCNTKRMSTVVSLGDTELLSIEKMHLEKVFGPDYRTLLLRNIAKLSIEYDKHFQFLSKMNIEKIIDNLVWKNFRRFEVVIPNGDKTLLRIIGSGSIFSEKNADHKISSYQVIGLGNSIEKILRPENYLAEEDLIVSEISVKMIEKLLNVTFEALFEHIKQVKFLKKIGIFRGFSISSYKKLVNELIHKNFASNYKIFQKGDDSLYLCIIKSGSVKIVNENKTLRVLTKNDVFGERCINEMRRTASAETLEKTELYMIRKSTLLELDEFKQLEMEIERKKYYQTQINFENFYINYEYPLTGIRRTFCVKNKNSKILYDLMVIPKDSIKSRNDFLYLINEKEIFLKIDHNLIKKLVMTNVDDFFIYFFTEHVEGNPLKSIISYSETFKKIVLAYIISIIDYLHDKNIVHRDICTNNFRINKEGYPHLIDCRYAKVDENRSYTRLGNPYYQSPELILGRGYMKSTDIWSAGVIFFELTYGFLPFTITDKDAPLIAYEKILHAKHGFLTGHSEDLNKLIFGMLSEVKERSDLNTVKNSKWFIEIEWENILSMKMQNFIDETFKFTNHNYLDMKMPISDLRLGREYEDKDNEFNFEKYFN